MAYCNHDDRPKRPLRIDGYDTPQMVCETCWERACQEKLVPA